MLERISLPQRELSCSFFLSFVSAIRLALCVASLTDGNHLGRNRLKHCNFSALVSSKWKAVTLLKYDINNSRWWRKILTRNSCLFTSASKFLESPQKCLLLTPEAVALLFPVMLLTWLGSIMDPETAILVVNRYCYPIIFYFLNIPCAFVPVTVMMLNFGFVTPRDCKLTSYTYNS